jgi:hypothetical protein
LCSPFFLSCPARFLKKKKSIKYRLQNRIEGYFKTFDRITHASWGRSIQTDGKTSTVIQRFSLEVEKGEKKNPYAGEEALFLKIPSEIYGHPLKTTFIPLFLQGTMCPHGDGQQSNLTIRGKTNKMNYLYSFRI